MNTYTPDDTKDVAVFINDFYPEIPPALKKLSEKLGRPLQGVMLIDESAQARGDVRPLQDDSFQEIVCDFSDDTALHSIVRQFEDRLLFVDATSERSQPYFKLILPHLPYVPGPTERSLEWATHKGQMRHMLAAYNDNLVPRVQIIRDNSDATITSVLGNLSLPYIVKPTGLSASILVNKVTNEDELREAVSHSLSVIHDIYARDAGRGTPELIIEEFMEGDMYSVDLYLNNEGHAWPLQPMRSRTAHSMGLEGFYEYQLESDLTLDGEAIKAGQETAIQAAHALGLRSCTAHVELYLTATGWKIIELGPRPGGHRQFMYEQAYGIDHAYNEFLVKAGLEPEQLNDTPIAHVAIANTYAQEEGIFEAVEGLDAVRALSSTVQVTVHAKAGTQALPSGKGGKIIVDAQLSNTDKQQLDKDLARLRELIVIRTRTE